MAELTEQQRQAVYGSEEEILVSAAAGSGKTKVLIDRILRLMKDGVGIDKMLVVTFTHAAAGEMRTRLERLLMAEPSMHREREKLASAQISTLHAFCMKMVRRYFQYCDIDPQFVLADEKQKARLYQAAMDSALDSIYTAAKEDDSLAALTDAYEEDDLSAMMTALYSHILSLPDPWGWMAHWSSPAATDELLESLPVLLGRIALSRASVLEKVRDDYLALEKTGLIPAVYQDALASDLTQIGRLLEACEKGWEPFTALMGSLTVVKLGSYRKKKRTEPDPEEDEKDAAAARFREIRDAYKDALKKLNDLIETDMPLRRAEMDAMDGARLGMEKALRMLHEAFTALKRDNRMLDFNDLEHLTLHILNQREVLGECRAMFDAIFVDEYQDTSPLQEGVLQALRRHDGTQRIFYVGDVKQSIYRFRKADPGLITEKGLRFTAEEGVSPRKIILDRNFRSRAKVLYGVNRVFSYVMNEKMLPPGYDVEGKLVPGRETRDDPAMTVHVLDGKLTAARRVEYETRCIADSIQAAVGRQLIGDPEKGQRLLSYRDICILMPRFSGVADQVKDLLERRNIPCYYNQRADLTMSEENRQLLDLLSLLIDPEQDVPLIAVMRGPLFSFTEEELAQVRAFWPVHGSPYREAVRRAAEDAEGTAGPVGSRCREVLDVLDRERRYLESMPLYEYLWDMLGRSGLYAYWGVRPGGALKQAKLRLLCEKAGEYAETHVDGLAGFLRSMDNDAGGKGEDAPSLISAQDDVVRLMTIHGSKGLQFPVVFLMGLSSSFTGRSDSRIVFNTDHGYRLRFVDRKEHRRCATLGQQLITCCNDLEDKQERGRLLYVAMTRAEEQLIIVGADPDLTFGGILGRSADAQPSPLAVTEVPNAFRWITDRILPTDHLTEVEGFSTDPLRINDISTELSTDSTSFPHKNTPWQVVFHKDVAEWCDPSAEESNETARNVEKLGFLYKLMPEVPPAAGHMPSRDEAVHDELLSHVDPTPLKVGVTALCRALAEGRTPEGVSGDEPYGAEGRAEKAAPFSAVRPRTMDTLPRRPEFLEPAESAEQLLRGTYTHLLISLIDPEAARAVTDRAAMQSLAEEKLSECIRKNLIPESESHLADTDMVARFYLSSLGRRMLASPRAEREWSFCLHITDPADTYVQGIIDLCFLENDQWVLVDFKTDRVSSPDKLWAEYERQLDIYRRALTVATPWPVKESILYSLRLGEASVHRHDI